MRRKARLFLFEDMVGVFLFKQNSKKIIILCLQRFLFFIFDSKEYKCVNIFLDLRKYHSFLFIQFYFSIQMNIRSEGKVIFY